MSDNPSNLELTPAQMGISLEVQKLGKVIDRLPPGEYIVRLKIPELKGVPMTGDIYRTERATTINLFR